MALRSHLLADVCFGSRISVVPPLLVSPLAEPTESPVVELALLALPELALMLVSALPLDAGAEVIGAVVVNGDVSACGV